MQQCSTVTIQSADRSGHRELESAIIVVVICIVIVFVFVFVFVIVIVITGRVHIQMCTTVRQDPLVPRWGHMPVPKTLPCLAPIQCAPMRRSLLSSSSSSSSIVTSLR